MGKSLMVLGVSVVAIFAAGCGKERGASSVGQPSKFAAVDATRLLAADEHAGQWMSHGRTYNEQRFSPLKQINVDTVGQLGLAWFADFDTNRGQEATPIVVDGTIYVTTAWSKVRAYKAKTGEPLWSYDPKVPGEWGVNACCDVVNRGVAAWNGKIYVGTLDGRLVALDAGTGATVWDVQVTDKTKQYTITGAPRVANGRVFIGEAGSEFLQRGFMSAYDAESGKLLWRWYIVPGNPADGFENKAMESAAQTWRGEWWKAGGGGGPWDAITYDPKTDLVLIGTGNGSPWPAEVRSPGTSDNLYLTSIVALRAATGEYAWHYQATPNDSWDYDNTQQITIADLTIDGKQRHVAMQASKNGFFYIVDAATGELLSAKNYVAINWATGIDMKTGRPNINPEARYEKTGKGFIVVPGPGGAHNWHPMSFNPHTGLVYIPATYTNYPMVVAAQDDNPMGQRLSISMTKGFAMYNEKDPKAKRINEAFLLAWDPVNQKEVWRVPFGSGRSGGTLSTAGGLVFQGNSKNQEFVAYRADNGEKLWSMPAQTGIVAGAATYEIDGDQYVSVVAGARQGGNYYSPNYSRLLTFKLGATAQLPPAVDPPPLVLNPPAAFGTKEAIAHGAETYQRFCGTCHGTDGQSRGLFPDLRYSATLHSAEAFKAIVIDGGLSSKGMVSFAKAVTFEDAEAIRAYLVGKAIDAKKNPPAAPFGAPPPAAQRPPTPAANPQPH